MLRPGVEKLRRPLREILRVKPATADQRRIEVMFNHPLKGPGLGALQRIQASVKVKTVFPLNVDADEGGICNPLAIVINVGQLSLWRGWRQGRLLAVG